MQRTINADLIPCRDKKTKAAELSVYRSANYNYQGYKYCMAGLSAAFSQYQPNLASSQYSQSVVLSTPGIFTYTGGLVSLTTSTLTNFTSSIYAENFFNQLETLIDKNTGKIKKDDSLGQDFTIDSKFNLNCQAVDGINDFQCNMQLGYSLQVENDLFPYETSTGNDGQVSTIEWMLSGAPLVSKVYIFTRAYSSEHLQDVNSNNFTQKYEVRTELKTRYVVEHPSARQQNSKLVNLDHFGFHIELMDVDNDNFKDILISAPSESLHGGQVFIYKNTGYLDSTFINGPTWTIHGPGILSNFGFKISNLGDLNMDGIDDFAVSATEYSESKLKESSATDSRATGAVFIYFGDNHPINFQAKQILLDSNPEVSGFGSSITVFPGQNLYPNLAVGTFSDQVLVYQSRPIIDLSINFENSLKFIKPHFVRPSQHLMGLTSRISNSTTAILLPEDSSTQISQLQGEIQLKIQFLEKTGYWTDEIPFDIDLKIDKNLINARASFDANLKISSMSQQVIGSVIGAKQNIFKTKICVPYRCNQTDCELQASDRLSPIQIGLSLKSSNQSYPVISEDSNKNFTSQIYIQKNCGDDNLCQSRLKFLAAAIFVNKNSNSNKSKWIKAAPISLKLKKLKPKPFEFYQTERIFLELGTENKLGLNLTAVNLQEDAHQSQMIIKLPKFMEFLSKNSDTRCSEGEDEISCQIGNPVHANQIASIFVESRRKEVDILQDFQIVAELKTTSVQAAQIYKLILPVKVRIAASLKISSIPEPNSELLDYSRDENKTPKSSYVIRHTYAIENTGTSTQENVILSVDLPNKLLNGKYLAYPLALEIRDYNDEFIDTDYFEVLGNDNCRHF